MKKQNTFFVRFALILAILGLIIIVLSIVLFLNKTGKIGFSLPINTSIWNDLGGFIAGLVGSILSLVTIVLIYVTYISQKEELALTREELIETRKIAKAQTEILGMQRFENTLFKLIDNHIEAIKRFDLNTTATAALMDISRNIKDYTHYFNYYLSVKRIIGHPLMNYNPSRSDFFNKEIVIKVIEDINQIGNFILSRSFLSVEDQDFYFSILFKNLQESERFLYGYQSDLKLERFNSPNSEKINLKYNGYYNNSDNQFKVKEVDLSTAYPPIELLFSNERIENFIRFKGIKSKRPLLKIRNLHEQKVSLHGVEIINTRNVHTDKGVELKPNEPKTLEPGEEFQLDLYNCIDHFYFNGQLGHYIDDANLIQMSANTNSPILTQISNDHDNNRNQFVIYFAMTDINNTSWTYYSELSVQIPRSIQEEFVFRLLNNFNIPLMTQLENYFRVQ